MRAISGGAVSGVDIPSFACAARPGCPCPAQFNDYPLIRGEADALMKEAAALLEAWDTRVIASIKASKEAVSRTGASVRNRLERQRISGARDMTLHY